MLQFLVTNVTKRNVKILSKKIADKLIQIIENKIIIKREESSIIRPFIKTFLPLIE